MISGTLTVSAGIDKETYSEWDFAKFLPGAFGILRKPGISISSSSPSHCRSCALSSSQTQRGPRATRGSGPPPPETSLRKEMHPDDRFLAHFCGQLPAQIYSGLRIVFIIVDELRSFFCV